uniref:Uncharacterized protein n=1 Tax=Parastrongyloides trichosuri TaxID=131310 RepID=A0A0N4ZSU5_PARTI
MTNSIAHMRDFFPITKDWSDAAILILFLLIIGFLIFFLYLFFYFCCTLFNSPSINEDELGQLRRKRNRMKKSFTNSILRRDVIVEMEENVPVRSREIYTCTTYKPVVNTNECVYPSSPETKNMTTLTDTNNYEEKKNSNKNSPII